MTALDFVLDGKSWNSFHFWRVGTPTVGASTLFGKWSVWKSTFTPSQFAKLPSQPARSFLGLCFFVLLLLLLLFFMWNNIYIYVYIYTCI